MADKKRIKQNIAATIAESLGDGTFRTKNVDVERQILHYCFRKPSHLQTITANLTVDDFSDVRHKVFYKYILDAATQGRLPDCSISLATAKRSTDFEVEPEDYEAGMRDILGANQEVDIEAACHLIHDLYIVRKILGFAKRIDANISEGADTAELIGHAEEFIRGVATDSIKTDTLKTIDEILESSPNGIRDFIERPRNGIPTPFDTLNEYIYGFQPGKLVIVGARPATGKAQPISSLVKASSGEWKKMGDIQVGDSLASVDGRESIVTGVFPQGGKEVLKVTFSDGRTVECCEDHLWEVHYRSWDKPRILTTAKVEDLLKKKRYSNKRISVSRFSGEFGKQASFIVSPWFMGYLIGNGRFSNGFSVSSASKEAIDRMKEEADSLGCSLNPSNKYDHRISAKIRGQENIILKEIRRLGLGGLCSYEKFIPRDYLNSSRADRLELLKGLMDSDGTCGKQGALQYSTSSERLSKDVQYLVRSLGGVCKISVKKEPKYTYKGERRIGRPNYVLHVIMDDPSTCFSLAYKAERAVRKGKSRPRLSFISIERTGRIEEMQCISVSHPRQLYITNDFTVTHNTALLCQIAYKAAAEGANVLFYSHEMWSIDMWTRIFCQEIGIRSDDFIHSMLTETEKKQVAEFITYSAPRNLRISDRGGRTPLSLRAELARYKAKYGNPDMVLVDYLQRMKCPNKSGNRFQEVSEISRSLKDISMEFDTRMIVAAQVSRVAENRPGGDNRPQMSDLRESGDIEADADLIIFPHRPSLYWKKAGQPPPPDELIIVKNRQGRTGIIQVEYKGAHYKFVERV